MIDLKLAVIGVGHLGKEHARILSGMRGVNLFAVVDVNVEQAKAIAQRTGAKAYSSHSQILDEVDAATIVAPTLYHHQIACDFLNRGIPLLVEKPLCATLTDAEEIVELAESRGTVLQVGHIERFNPAFEELQQRPIQPKFIKAERIGPFTGRSMDIGVVLDLMIHDLDLLLSLTNSTVQNVDALGVSLFGEHEDIANARLHFADGCVADVTASRSSPDASRCMRIWAPEGYAKIDFQSRRLSLAQPLDVFRQIRPDVRSLDHTSRMRLRNEFFDRYFQTVDLDCNHGDQLTRELDHFVHCVRTGARPIVSGADGLKAIALAERVLDGIRQHRWEGHSDGAAGPNSLPAPLGQLISHVAITDKAA